MIKTLKECSDLESLPLGMASVMAGSAAAAYMGNFELLIAILCFIFVVCLQITGNLLHRYSLTNKKWGGGLERYMLTQSMGGDQTKLSVILSIGATITGLIAATVGVALLGIAGESVWILLVAALIVVYMYFNSFSPRPISRTKFSVITTFIMYGPVAVIATTYVQASYHSSHDLTWHDFAPAIVSAIIVGLYAVNIQSTNDLQSYEFDKQRGKKTLSTWLGPKGAAMLLIANGIVGALVAVVALLILPNREVWIPITIFVASAVMNTIIVMNIYRHRSDNEGMKWRYAMNWICFCAMTLMFIYTYVLGHPDVHNLEIF